MRKAIVATLAFVLPFAASGARAVPDYVTTALSNPARSAADDGERHIADIMVFAQVKPGQKVVELIPGEGYWTRVFSGIVGEKGRVYTVWPDGYQQYVEESYADWQKLVTTTYKNVSLIGSGA